MTALIVAYLVSGVLASRWTVGSYVQHTKDEWHQDALDEIDWITVVMIFLATVGGWPGLLPFLLVRGVYEVTKILGVHRAIKRFYTLDGQARKEIG